MQMPKPQPKMDLDFLVTELSMVGDHLLIDRMETDDGSTARFHVTSVELNSPDGDTVYGSSEGYGVTVEEAIEAYVGGWASGCVDRNGE
jgi:hypothetical protein